MEIFWNLFEKLEGIKPLPIVNTQYNKGQICADQYNNNECNLFDFPCFKEIDFSLTLECDWNNRSDQKSWDIESLRNMGANLMKTIDLYFQYDFKAITH